MGVAGIAAGSSAFDIAIEGYRRATRRMDAAAARIASGGALDPEPIIDLTLAEHQGRANLAVLRTAERMQDELLDILA